MKVVFIGGGAHRYLGVARSILADKKVSERGEIRVFDLNQTRAEAMRETIKKTPEFKATDCRVSSPTSLDQALSGADAVCVVLMAMNWEKFSFCGLICNRHGFIGSDQLSPSGAMLALKGGPILMDIAKRMEKLCPEAWLLDFANPVAVLSGAVNNHTKIKSLGICGGDSNCAWNVARLFGKDEEEKNLLIDSAGINHMSFVLQGSKIGGRDLYEAVAAKVTAKWKMPRLSARWDKGAIRNITWSVENMVRLYRKYGYLIYSTEGDGMAHVDIAGLYNKGIAAGAKRTRKSVLDGLKRFYATRKKADEAFTARLKEEMSDADWDRATPENLVFLRDNQNVMAKVVKGVAGAEGIRTAASFPNQGAVVGFKDRTVLEYSQIINKTGVRPAGRYEIPDLFQGLVSALATHQTLLGDAIATEDPKILFEALYSYPVKQDTKEQKQMWIELLRSCKDEISPKFRSTAEYFKK